MVTSRPTVKALLSWILWKKRSCLLIFFLFFFFANAKTNEKKNPARVMCGSMKENHINGPNNLRQVEKPHNIINHVTYIGVAETTHVETGDE